jgi:hypothetical protein
MGCLAFLQKFENISYVVRGPTAWQRISFARPTATSIAKHESEGVRCEIVGGGGQPLQTQTRAGHQFVVKNWKMRRHSKTISAS